MALVRTSYRVYGKQSANLENRGVAVDDDGNIFFTDASSGSVLMKPVDGGALRVLVTKADLKDVTGDLGGDPKAITIGSDGNLYVSDDTSDSVIRIDPVSGEATQVVSRSDFTSLPGIESVDLDGGIVATADGTVYAVSDGGP